MLFDSKARCPVAPTAVRLLHLHSDAAAGGSGSRCSLATAHLGKNVDFLANASKPETCW